MADHSTTAAEYVFPPYSLSPIIFFGSNNLNRIQPSTIETVNPTMDEKSGLHESTGSEIADPATSKALSSKGSVDEKGVYHSEEPIDGMTADDDEPTEHEKETLRHVAENLPLAAWLVAIVELCERFTYYGVQGLFQNYVQRPLDGSLGRGALGLGHVGATGLTTFFQFWCYGKPLKTSRFSSQ
jgi:hypothetical protein